MSRKQAIEKFCRACIYDPRGGSGTWRQQVEACTAKKCTLYRYRAVSRPCLSTGIPKERSLLPANIKAEKEPTTKPPWGEL